MSNTPQPVLFSRGASMRIVGGGLWMEGDWPFGRIELDSDAVTFTALVVSYRLEYTEIDEIRFGWLGIQVKHHSANVPKSVELWGWGLKRSLRDAIQSHQLPVRIT